MCTTDVDFYPLIITGRPTESPYQQAPHGTDMTMLRIVPVPDVRSGDLVLGCHDGHLNPNKLRWTPQSAAAFVALPIWMHGAVCLDGETPAWELDEYALIIPREYRPAAAYAPGDRVERTVLFTPQRNNCRDEAGETRAVMQRGTVTSVEDGAALIAWDGDWMTAEIPETGFRPVDPERVERERSATGFAVGDRVTHEEDNATGVVLELWSHWWDARTMARVYFPPTEWSHSGRHEMAEAHRFSHALPAYA
ncbi:hypothetical protein ACPCSC_30165 [Streptomyces lavendulocolor]|uniref:hypothetical protein n=1 Tax=Streptomyces lavendulocolor TaxID=67316 RepID=UPI003C2C5ED4